MNTRMKFLEHELAEQEREQLRKAEMKEQPAAAAVPDNTLVLERKVRELEALINGLTEELLDLKSVTRKLSAQIEKLGGTPVKSHPENIIRGGMRKPEAEPVPAAGRGIQAAVPAREAPAVPQAPAAGTGCRPSGYASPGSSSSCPGSGSGTPYLFADSGSSPCTGTG